jgi:hypothetical protein
VNRTATRLLEAIPDPDMPDVNAGAANAMPVFQPGLPEVAQRFSLMGLDPSGNWCGATEDEDDEDMEVEGDGYLAGVTEIDNVLGHFAVIYEGRGYYAPEPEEYGNWDWEPLQGLVQIVAYKPVAVAT